MNFSILSIILPVCVMLHVTEEFLFPGGFVEWYEELVPSKTAGIRPRYLIRINTLMVGVCVVPIWLGQTQQGVSVWFTIAAIAGINACFHVAGELKLKKYSPGVFTGVLLYLPLFTAGSFYLVSTNSLNIIKAIIILAIAIGYHIFSLYRQAENKVKS